MGKISGMIIGILFMSFIVFVFSYFILSQAEENNINFDNSTLLAYEEYKGEIESNVTSYRDKMENNTGLSGDDSTDYLGKLFSGGYSAVKMTGKSFDTLTRASGKAIEKAGLEESKHLKDFIYTLIFIIVIFSFILVLTKVDL